MEILERIESIIKTLADKKLLVALAESCTGGYISHMITNISGSSKVFERGVVSYGNQAKIDILKVDPETLEKFGAVSEEVAKQMANGVRVLSKPCDIGIGVTGIAGPTGGTPEKPVGLVYIGFSSDNKNFVEKFNFKTDRINFKNEILKKVLQFLEEYINKS
ncbi:MAG: CinA family protein [Promethearchaeota archaeon]|nr:MAG: CinA family protein [Candidatus Lokiarchaeota archaeon]